MNLREKKRKRERRTQVRHEARRDGEVDEEEEGDERSRNCGHSSSRRSRSDGSEAVEEAARELERVRCRSSSSISHPSSLPPSLEEREREGERGTRREREAPSSARLPASHSPCLCLHVDGRSILARCLPCASAPAAALLASLSPSLSLLLLRRSCLPSSLAGLLCRSFALCHRSAVAVVVAAFSPSLTLRLPLRLQHLGKLRRHSLSLRLSLAPD